MFYGLWPHFQREIRSVGVTGSAVNIDDRVPRENEAICYTIVSVENESTANSDLEIGINTPQGFIPLRKFLNVAALDRQTFSDYPIVVSGDNHLRVVVIDSATGDGLSVGVHGFVKFLNDTAS